MPNKLNKIFPKLHDEGYKFLAIFAFVTIILYFINGFLGFLGLILTIWCYYFFRDPERFSINDETFLISPADGVVSQIAEVKGPQELGLENKQFTRISIFMNVFDCHVNRFPSSGKIDKIFYKPGKYLNASLDKSSDENERNYIKMTNSHGDDLVLVQIAGLIARRIVCEVEQGQSLKQGDRIGMIRFGSRVDIYFKNKKVLAKVGQNVVAGESLIASE